VCDIKTSAAAWRCSPVGATGAGGGGGRPSSPGLLSTVNVEGDGELATSEIVRYYLASISKVDQKSRDKQCSITRPFKIYILDTKGNSSFATAVFTNGIYGFCKSDLWIFWVGVVTFRLIKFIYKAALVPRCSHPASLSLHLLSNA
jgi:hypothetical protein